MRVAQLRYRPPCGVGLVFADDMEALRAGVLAPHNHRRAKLNTGSYPIMGSNHPCARPSRGRGFLLSTTSLLAGHAADLRPTSLPDAS